MKKKLFLCVAIIASLVACQKESYDVQDESIADVKNDEHNLKATTKAYKTEGVTTNLTSTSSFVELPFGYGNVKAVDYEGGYYAFYELTNYHPIDNPDCGCVHRTNLVNYTSNKENLIFPYWGTSSAKSLNDVVGICTDYKLSPSRVWAFYDDLTYSVGHMDDFRLYKVGKTYKLPTGKIPDDIVDVTINIWRDGSFIGTRVFTVWFRDGKCAYATISWIGLLRGDLIEFKNLENYSIPNYNSIYGVTGPIDDNVFSSNFSNKKRKAFYYTYSN